MPEVMKPHGWKACFLEQPLQPQERMIGVQVRSIRATEDKIVLPPGSTGRSPLCFLASAMLYEHFDEEGRQHDLSSPGFRFRLRDLQPIPYSVPGRMAYLKITLLKVNNSPAQGDKHTAPHGCR